MLESLVKAYGRLGSVLMWLDEANIAEPRSQSEHTQVKEWEIRVRELRVELRDFLATAGRSVD